MSSFGIVPREDVLVVSPPLVGSSMHHCPERKFVVEPIQMTIQDQLVLFLRVNALTILLLCLGCHEKTKEETKSTINPKGVFAQLLRIDARSNTEDFETLMAQLVEVADSVTLPNPYYWICYHELPHYYWLLTISDSLDNFVYPGSIPGFAARIGRFAIPSQRNEILKRSHALGELPVERNVTQQYSDWSTTNNVESRDFPKSSIVIYQVNETDLLPFHQEMSKLVDFLSSHHVAYQVEGFIAHPRTSNVAWQVIFLPADAPFSTGNENYEFSIELDNQALDRLFSLQEKINSYTNGIEYFNGTRIDSLSYGTY